MGAAGKPARAFFAFRDSPQRRAALRAPVGASERYLLFGLDEIAAHGVRVEHNLRVRFPAWARPVDRLLQRIVYGVGGYGGDFASILPSLPAIRRADVVLSTVDTVGIPLVLLKRLGLVRTPIVYVAIGLPERLAQLRRFHGLYRTALLRARAIVTYAESEAARLRSWLGPEARVVFVPFGVDTNAFRPLDREPEFDVVAIGADPRRDFSLLADIAQRRPDLTFRIVASADHARTLTELPQNVTVEADISLDAVRDRLAASRAVALPVRDNSYSGATTTLLQAMAMAKPVVVSRTDAIATGYGLEDRVNCRLVAPGDADAFERSLVETLTGAGAGTALGIRARETVERSLSWERYTNALWSLLSD
jgi:glycosyltransferase involved in cell wall biosynthesis